MKSKIVNQIIVFLVSLIFIAIIAFGIYFTFIKEGKKEINIENATINISNEANFDDINAMSIDVGTAKKLFELEDDEFIQISGRIPIVNAHSSMFVIIRANESSIENVEKKLIEYGNKYEKQWENQNAEQLELVKNRVIGKKDDVVYLIIAKNAANLEKYVK